MRLLELVRLLGTPIRTPATPPPAPAAVPLALRAAFLAAVAGWAAIMAHAYFVPAYVPDEVMFGEHGARFAETWRTLKTRKYLKTQENDLGYGAGYWIVQAAAHRYTPDPAAAMRVVAFACLTTIPVCIGWHARRHGSPFGWPAVLLWLGTPMAWWTGKLTGPELISVALGTAGAVASASAARWGAGAGGLFLGLAVGVKAGALPFAAFALVAARKPDGRTWAGFAARLLVGSAAGLAAANPFAVAHPGKFRANVVAAATPCEPTWVKLENDLCRDTWQWDAVYDGGLFNFGYPAVVLGLIGVWLLAARPPARVAAAAAAGCGLTAALVLRTYTIFGWYWFPAVAIVPLACAAAPARGRLTPALATALVALAGLNLYLLRERVTGQLAGKWEHQRAVAAAAESGDRARRAIAGLSPPPQMVLDFTYADLDLRLRPAPPTRNCWAPMALAKLLRRPGERSTLVVLVVSPRLLSQWAEFSGMPLAKPWTPYNPFGYRFELRPDPYVRILGYQIAGPPDLSGI